MRLRKGHSAERLDVVPSSLKELSQSSTSRYRPTYDPYGRALGAGREAAAKARRDAEPYDPYERAVGPGRQRASRASA